ncbi:MAG TPA: ferrous iron transport protein A [Firmicutes bacterium]|nr:ferrous iron transport protein A [Bacillota bacterium]
MTLADLKPGEFGQIQAINAKGPARRRLLDLGLVPNTKVQAVLKSPLGDPKAFLVRGAVLAFRLKDAREVLITRCLP